VHRAYGVRNGGDEFVVVEVENQSPVPVALALAVRPMNLEGLAVVERIGLQEGTTVTVDGRVAMLLPKPPSRVAGSTYEKGDVASVVLAGEAGERLDTVQCPAGLASAAFIWPLPHRTTMRVALPIVAANPARRRAPRMPALPAVMPSAQQVANGWRLQGDRGMRVVVPDERLQSAVDANRRFLLLLHDDMEVKSGPSATDMASALDRCGYIDEARSTLASCSDRLKSESSG